MGYGFLIINAANANDALVVARHYLNTSECSAFTCDIGEIGVFNPYTDEHIFPDSFDQWTLDDVASYCKEVWKKERMEYDVPTIVAEKLDEDTRLYCAYKVAEIDYRARAVFRDGFSPLIHEVFPAEWCKPGSITFSVNYVPNQTPSKRAWIAVYKIINS